MNIPEGAQTVSIEGNDLKSAVAAAAEQLGIETKFVGHKVDLSHFRSKTGGMIPRTTVKIIAWQSEEEVASVAAPKGAKRDDGERRSRDRDDRGDRRERRGRDRDRDRGDRRGRDRDRDRGERRDRDDKSRRRGAEEAATEASDYAAAWMSALLGHLDLQGTVTGTGSDERVHLALQIEGKAGRLIGKRGATLRSVRKLLKSAIDKQYGELELDVDVNDDRPRDNNRDSDRGEKKGRGRGRNRRGGREDRGRYPEEKLTALANKAAAKAAETGQTITINLELNSYDRRIVHMAIADIDNVDSRSEERTSVDGDGNEVTVKFVQVIPAASSDEGEE